MSLAFTYGDLLVIRRALLERESRLVGDLRSAGLTTSDELEDLGEVIDRVTNAIRIDLNRMHQVD